MTDRALFHRGGETETYGLAATDAIPATVHGFRVKMHLGPHPQPTRRYPVAFFVRLIPDDADIAAKMWRAGKQEISAITPLSKPGARLIRSHPNGQLSENVAKVTLAEASRLARIVADA